MMIETQSREYQVIRDQINLLFDRIFLEGPSKFPATSPNNTLLLHSDKDIIDIFIHNACHWT